jgi:peptidoglycan/LPS O-acetylase OafA/YrhL
MRTDRGANGALARGTIDEIDGLRGVAIALVMLHRFWPRSGPLAAHAALANVGWVGVDLFFVVSGFLITGILLDTRGERGWFKNFWARRALRIFPLYYAFVALAFVAFPLLEGARFGASGFVRESGSPLWYAFYLGNVREALVGHEPSYFLGTLWSLSIEEQFYLTFPLVVALLGPRRLRPALVGLVAFAPAFRLATMLAWPGAERVQYLATPSRVDVIAVGALLALLLRSEVRLPSPRASAFGLAAAAAAFAVAWGAGGLDRTQPFGRVLGYSIVAVLFGALVLFTLLHRDAPATALLRARPLRALGKLCYGLYLLHRPADAIVGAVTHRLTILASHPALGIAARFAVAIALATASWHLFEKRVLALKTRFSSPRHPATLASAAPRLAA